MAVVEITKDNFESEVLNSDKPVLVDFNAGWCGPCKMLKPIIDELAESRSDVKFASVNIDDEDILAEDYDVYSIPCLVVFKGGKEVKRSVGLLPKAEVEKLIGE